MSGQAAGPGSDAVRLIVKSGDILDEAVDVLVSSANPHLRMSGGVNGAILLRGGEAVQRELDAHLARLGRRWVERGTVVVTGPGPLAVRHIIHAVAVDGFYQTTVEVVAQAIRDTLEVAVQLRASTVALTALATGYGRLPVRDFARALASVSIPANLKELRVVLRHPDEAAAVREVLVAAAPGVIARTVRRQSRYHF